MNTLENIQSIIQDSPGLTSGEVTVASRMPEDKVKKALSNLTYQKRIIRKKEEDGVSKYYPNKSLEVKSIRRPRRDYISVNVKGQTMSVKEAREIYELLKVLFEQ